MQGDPRGINGFIADVIATYRKQEMLRAKSTNIGIVGPVGQHLICGDAPYEVAGRSHVILLTGTETEADRQAQSIDYGMDFRTEPAS